MKWVVGLVLAGCISPVMHFGAGKSPHEAQHDTLEELTPAVLSTEGAFRGTPRDVKIRVYADDEYRAQNLHWQQTFGEELRYANAVLGPQFGVHLVPEYREWNHHAPANGLPADLEELRALDAGTDVLSVVGLTSSLSLVSATFDLLGYASVPGHHVMLRGYADLEERKNFARAFPDLTSDERDNALEARRRHKTAAVLLHELAHNLGVNHETATDSLMSPMYSEHASAFSSEAHQIIQRSLGGGTPEPAHVPHETLSVHVMADSVTVDDESKTDDEQTAAFRSAGPTTELVIHKDKGVPSTKLVEVIDRAKAAGLSKFTMQ